MSFWRLNSSCEDQPHPLRAQHGDTPVQLMGIVDFAVKCREDAGLTRIL